MIDVFLSQHLPLVLCVVPDTFSHRLPLFSLHLFTFRSPFLLLSTNIKLWLLCKCIQHSNIIHCSKLKIALCFSSLHHFVAVSPFPLYVLLAWMGNPPFF